MKLHHIKILCVSPETASATFCNNYGFTVCGTYLMNKTIVLRLNELYLTIEQGKYINTVNDVCFRVESVSKICKKVTLNGGLVVEKPHFIDCQMRRLKKITNKCCLNRTCQGYIEKAIIRSSVESLNHSIINKTQFRGDFLPGFHFDSCKKMPYLDDITGIDHIAIAVNTKATGSHVDWYKTCLDCRRVKFDNLERESGLLLQSNNRGLHMFTLQQHPCSNDALLCDTGEEEIANESVKIVFVESRSANNDQISDFLNYHESEGVQHIAFGSNDVLRTVSRLRNNGVQFIKPPKYYYNEICNTLKSLKHHVDTGAIKDLGILVDSEKVLDISTNELGYLYQIFTPPVFGEGFFLEVIKRDRARGFGLGNIMALWKSIERYNNEQLSNS